MLPLPPSSLGQSADPQRQTEMLTYLEARPEIDHVISLITLQLGNDVMVAVQAEMHEEQTMRDLATQIDVIEREFKTTFPEARWSFFELDIKAGIEH